jgi:hypothetical protein
MVTQQRTFDFLTSPEFKETREFLARFGISPRQPDEYSLDEVLRAVSTKPWECTIEAEVNPPGWKAEIREWRTVTQSRTAIGRDPDRMLALLRAIRFALSWPSPEEEMQAFEHQTQTVLGISAEEFMQRWYANELPIDDPRVGYLLVARPLGW